MLLVAVMMDLCCSRKSGSVEEDASLVWEPKITQVDRDSGVQRFEKATQCRLHANQVVGRSYGFSSSGKNCLLVCCLSDPSSELQLMTKASDAIDPLCIKVRMFDQNNDSASELCDFFEPKGPVSNPIGSQENLTCYSRHLSSGKRNPRLPLRKLHITPRPRPNTKKPQPCPPSASA